MMKISISFALRLFLALDILAMSASCIEAKRRSLEPQAGQPVPSMQPSTAGEGQACRDQIVSCYPATSDLLTCPQPGQRIDIVKSGSWEGCSEHAICICRCPAIPVPKPDPQ